jgi:hypothetical protein
MRLFYSDCRFLEKLLKGPSCQPGSEKSSGVRFVTYNLGLIVIALRLA